MTLPSSALARRALGIALRDLRERADLSMDAAASRLGVRQWDLSRWEKGLVRIARSDIVDRLSRVYDLAPERAGQLQVWLDESKQPDWWQAEFGEVVSKWFRRYLGLEPGATSLRTYYGQLVPGLLQTRGYAQVVIGEAADTDENKRRRVELRLTRSKNIFDSANPPRTFFLLDEGAVARMVGGVEVMREQWTHLVDISNKPGVTVRIIPLDAGYYRALTRMFVILGFNGAEDDWLAYTEDETGGNYFDDRAEVKAYETMFEGAATLALGRKESLSLLQRLIRRHMRG